MDNKSNVTDLNVTKVTDDQVNLEGTDAQMVITYDFLYSVALPLLNISVDVYSL